jgi:predicted metalloendopeptidase
MSVSKRCGRAATLLIATALAACAANPAHAPRSGLQAANFDPAVRVQDDLFGHVNGEWLAHTAIPADQSNYGAFARLNDDAQANVHALLDAAVRRGSHASREDRKAADLYRSFMDTATVEVRGLAPLQAELARVAALQSGDDVAAYLGWQERIGVRNPLAWSVQQDARDAASYVIGIDQGGLTLPDRDYYLRNDARYLEYRQKLVAYMTELLQLAGQADAARQAAAVMAIEQQLATAQWSRVQNRDPIATYNKLTLTELAALAPGLNWPVYLAAVGAPADNVVVGQPGYLAALSGLLRSVPLADWQAYFRFHLLDDYAELLSSPFEQLHFGFHQRTLSGVEEQRPRWKRGVELVNQSLGEISGRMYVQRYFGSEARRRMQALVANLLHSFDASIDSLEWMSPETRVEARRKLAAISVKIGYTDKWRDYSALEITPDDLVGNVMRAAQFETRRRANKLGKPVDRGEWHMTPQTVNAYYNPTLNEIVFPAAILQPPFFDARADDAVNYGGIGAVIGHEISHGFDDSGRHFDGSGNLRDWWSTADAQRFEERTRALVAQYAACRVLDDQPVNGELTLGENIADLTGLAIAYKAYQRSLQGRAAPVIDGNSGAQRFFYGWAQVWQRKYRDDNLRARLSVDPHSPSQFRANVPASNIDAFYDAFGLRPGDGLYREPAERVRIW